MECDRNICFQQDYNGGCKSCPCNEEAEPQILVETEEGKAVREFADLIVARLEELAEEYPYKVAGNYDTYGPYNEAWETCCDRAIQIVRKAVE